MMLCVIFALVVVGCASKTVCQSVRDHHASGGVDNAASPDWQTPLNRIISPSERLITMPKNNWKEPEYINEQCEWGYPYRWAIFWYCEQYTRFPAEYKCLSNKTEQSIYECLLGFCFNNIFCRHKFWLHRQFSSAQFQKRRNDGWWFPFGATAAGLFWTVNVCWAHPVISRASAVASSIFHGVIPDAFEVRRITWHV